MNSIDPARRRPWRPAIAIALASMLTSPAAAGGTEDVSFLARFDPAQRQFPEGIASSGNGTLYVTWTMRDELVAIDPDGNISVSAELPSGSAPAGIAVTEDDVIYVAAGGVDLATGTTDPEVRGVYVIEPGAPPRRIPGSEDMTFPNDVTLDAAGDVYATDTVSGTVWKIPKLGTPRVWASDELLEGTGAFEFGFPIGANGIAVDHESKRVIVANPEKGLLVSVPIGNDGSAGDATVLARSPMLVGADGIVLGADGAVYVVAGIQDQVVVLEDDGGIETLATADDGLNQPATLTFGAGPRDDRSLFVTNFSLLVPDPTPGVLAFPTDRRSMAAE